jgi:hypothetical protein
MAEGWVINMRSANYPCAYLPCTGRTVRLIASPTIIIGKRNLTGRLWFHVSFGGCVEDPEEAIFSHQTDQNSSCL